MGASTSSARILPGSSKRNLSEPYSVVTMQSFVVHLHKRLSQRWEHGSSFGASLNNESVRDLEVSSSHVRSTWRHGSSETKDRDHDESSENK